MPHLKVGDSFFLSGLLEAFSDMVMRMMRFVDLEIFNGHVEFTLKGEVQDGWHGNNEAVPENSDPIIYSGT